MKITYYVHDLKFPLTEGYRKEAWFLAKESRKKGYEVEILSTSKKNEVLMKEGIKITYGSVFKISKCNADVIHYISQPSPLILPLLLRAKAKKQIMTIFGGHLNSFWERPWDFFISKLVNKKISILTVQTDFQMQLLGETKLNIETKKIPPLISDFKRDGSRDKDPSILFMTHMNELKGINDVIDAFLLTRDQIKGLKLVIADSGMTKNSKIKDRLVKINKGDIILKKIVDPQKELSKTWVYVYPLQTARETFSVPLSLIEAIQIKTPYISTNVGGIPEYFDDRCLVPPKDPNAIADKIKEFIAKPDVFGLKKEINNKEVAKEYMGLYG